MVSIGFEPKKNFLNCFLSLNNCLTCISIWRQFCCSNQYGISKDIADTNVIIINNEQMEYNKQYLYHVYNGTCTEDENGDVESYENWLEKQLIARIERIDEMQAIVSTPPTAEEQNDRLQRVGSRFCFICGNPLEDKSNGWMQCESDECGEVFRKHVDENRFAVFTFIGDIK